MHSFHAGQHPSIKPESSGDTGSPRARRLKWAAAQAQAENEVPQPHDFVACGFTKTNPKSGVRLGVKGGGCSGMSYVIEYCDQPRPKDQLFEVDGAKIYVDPKSLVYLNGTTFDFVDTFQQKGFKFVNPQVKSECGCGESFTV